MKRSPILLAGALLLAGLAGPAAQARTILAATPISRTDLRWWKARFAQKQQELAASRPELVLYGDSITQVWEFPEFAPAWHAFYGDRHAVNLGFIGDTTASLLWRIEHGEAQGISPKAAIILIGANNMGRPHWSAEDTVLGIETIVQELRRRLPNTKLLLLSVLPSDRGEWVMQTTRAVNQALATTYGSGKVPDVTYQDVSQLFLRDGKVDKSVFRDPQLVPPQPALHPNPEGATRLAEAIEPTLAHMLGDRPHSPPP
jgi:lysophospholipase L1-like esterase